MSNVHANARALLSLLRYAPMEVAGGREALHTLAGMAPSIFPLLAETLSDRSEPSLVRMAAAWLLGRRGGRQAELVLLRALNDPDGDVAEAVAHALGEKTAGSQVAISAPVAELAVA